MNLPRAMYLLCHDLDRARLGEDTDLVRGALLRAAAVADLRLSGLLTDDGGRAARVPALGGPDDGFLADVLAAVPLGGTASWFSVVDTAWDRAEARVRGPLVELGVITPGRRRLCVAGSRTVSVSPEAGAVRTRVRAAVHAGDAGTVPVRDAVLAVLAVDGDVRTVFGRLEHRRHRAGIRALGARVDAELPGLRTALGWSIAGLRTAASAWEWSGSRPA